MADTRVIPHSRRAVAGLCAGGGFVICGGFGARGVVGPAEVTAEMWRYDDGWTALAPAPYAARYPSLCADGRGGFYLFGGCGYDGKGTTFLNALYRHDGGWERIDPAAGPIPEGRYTSLMARSGDGLLIFGGNSQRQDRTHKMFYPDLWRFDLVSRRWERLHGARSGPGPRYGFGWCVDAGAAYLFGGYDGERDRGDLWRLDLADASWTHLADEGAGPEPRYCPALGSVDGALVLFGGRSKVRPKDNFSDTWVFDGDWSRHEGGPAPGYHAKAACASDGCRMWLFGGEGPSGHVSDLWTYDAQGWRRKHEARRDDPILW